MTDQSTTSPAAARADGYLKLEELKKSFGSVNVIGNFSLSVRKGEFVSLLGPSGCGKTTILRMIAGFFPIDNGRILLDEQRIDTVPSNKRGAAMVFQNYALFPHMTVGENVAFGLRMNKVPKPEITRRVGEALDMVRLRNLIGRYPRELSGGQQQRIALARALVINPKILLLDEPLSNLDAKLRKELRAELHEIHRLAGITTIFVTHDLEEAFSVSDRIAVLNHGHLEQFGTPVDIFMRPQTPFVADFIGHSNVLSGTVVNAGGERVMAWNGHTVKIAADAAEGRPIRLAIPAHLVRIAPETLPFDNTFRARVRSLTYLGAMVQIEVEVGGAIIHAESASAPVLLKLREGDDVFVGWRREDFILLPSEGS